MWVGDVYCWHLKSTFVEAWTATKFLDYLHHHPLQTKAYVSLFIQCDLRGWKKPKDKGTYLTVCFIPSFICLAQVKKKLVATLLTQLLHNVERTFAECLTHRVKEDKYQVCLFTCTKSDVGGTHQL